MQVSLAVSEDLDRRHRRISMYPGLTMRRTTRCCMLPGLPNWAACRRQLVDDAWARRDVPHRGTCGTVLGLIHARAEPDGGAGITGTRSVHQRRRRVREEYPSGALGAGHPGAPGGTEGIDLFVVAEVIPDDSWPAHRRSQRRCRTWLTSSRWASHLGLATAMNFLTTRPTAERSMRPHDGMRAMFTMMNEARLGTGIQGLGIAEAAYQSAADYARDRRQGRALDPARRDGRCAGRQHPGASRRAADAAGDARHHLSRASAALVGQPEEQAATRAAHGKSIGPRGQGCVALVFSDRGDDRSRQALPLAVRVLGGHGYIHEWGVEQFVRDARIAQIYEGTNGVQALDLVGRKLGQNTGRLLRRVLPSVSAFLDARTATTRRGTVHRPTRQAFAAYSDDPGAGAEGHDGGGGRCRGHRLSAAVQPGGAALRRFRMATYRKRSSIARRRSRRAGPVEEGLDEFFAGGDGDHGDLNCLFRCAGRASTLMDVPQRLKRGDSNAAGRACCRQRKEETC